MDAPVTKGWLTIIGLQEDGLEGLSARARRALDQATTIFGGPRHLDLVGAGPRARPWPRPFSIAPVLAERGRPTVVLASGDPFHFGAGRALAQALPAGEWHSLPAPSTFALAANALGWPLEDCLCRALHAAPPEVIRDDLGPQARLIALMRDANAPHQLARLLVEWGVTAEITVLERLGGPHQRILPYRANQSFAAPLAVALQVIAGAGDGGKHPAGLTRAAGLPETVFAHDGQITKSPIRAVTLAALAPRMDEMLWDLGAGSGSVAIEWCRLGGRAVAVESRADRARNIAANTAAFGLGSRLALVEGSHLDTIAALPRPDAVFVGGGFSQALFEGLSLHAKGARLVVNAVTLETEALLVALAANGGRLMRFELSQAQPLGPMRGWKTARPVTQWITTL